MHPPHVGSPIHLASQDKLARLVSWHLVNDASLRPMPSTVLRATWLNRLPTATPAHMGHDVTYSFAVSPYEAIQSFTNISNYSIFYIILYNFYLFIFII
jgi:hypothetical protein